MVTYGTKWHQVQHHMILCFLLHSDNPQACWFGRKWRSMLMKLPLRARWTMNQDAFPVVSLYSELLQVSSSRLFDWPLTNCLATVLNIARNPQPPLQIMRRHGLRSHQKLRAPQSGTQSGTSTAGSRQGLSGFPQQEDQQNKTLFFEALESEPMIWKYCSYLNMKRTSE